MYKSQIVLNAVRVALNTQCKCDLIIILYTAATCTLATFQKKDKFKQTLKTADEAYSSALSWIYKMQKPAEKRADDEARWGSVLIVLAGEEKGW